MRILKISDVYFPRVNGVSTSIRTFAREFTRSGHEVQLIAPHYPTPGPEEPFDIHRMPSRYLPMDPEDRLMRGRPVRELTQQLRAEAFDLVHIHTPFQAHYLGLHLARELGLPVVETYHTYFEEYLGKYLRWLPDRLLRLAARRFTVSQADAVDALVVPSEPMLEVLRGYGVSAHARVIPTGLPDDELPEGNGARFRARHGIPAERPVLLYVGRVAHEKNIGFLIEMLTKLRHDCPEVLLVIAGEGPAEAALRQQVARAGLEQQVQFVGYLSRDQALADCYAAGDAFVFASSTETQGLVLLEAMKLGTPVVTTAVMGTAAIMADGRGGLVAEQDSGHFASQCLRVLRDPELRRQLSEQGRDKAGEWHASTMAERMLELYEHLAEGNTLPLLNGIGTQITDTTS
jgi:glycosyltransferase involved in cell wall biosynthesis